ncbi:MAG: 2-hydroxyacyl-CoA dehydratase [Candidatus Limivicinus sp.]|jgi:hypothetical protein
MNHDAYREFLKYLEFTDDDLKNDLENFKYVCGRVGITEERLDSARTDWIPNNWNAQYKGVRMALGVLVKEFIDTCMTPKYKAEGNRLVYGILPSHCNLYYALEYADPSIFVSFPDILLTMVLNGILHMAGPFFEAAESEGLTPGCRHCPLNKMRYTAFMKGIIAAPDVIWSWGFNCDEGPKTDELIQNMLGKEWRYVISRCPHDSLYGVDDDKVIRKVEHVASELRSGFNTICDIVGVKVLPEHFKQANDDFLRVSFKVAQLTQMICRADPPVMSGNTLTVVSSFQLVPFNRGLKGMEDAIDTLLGELRQAMKDGVGILPKGSPKVACYFDSAPVPWYDRIFLDNGVCTTYSLITSITKNQLNKNYISDDPFMVMAETWLRRGSIQNMGSDIESMVEKVETNKPDGVIMGFFDFDRWLGAHQKIAAKKVEERTGVPHFYMECDFYDDRDYGMENMRTRIESICQVLKMRKEMEE